MMSNKEREREREREIGPDVFVRLSVRRLKEQKKSFEVKKECSSVQDGFSTMARNSFNELQQFPMETLFCAPPSSTFSSNLHDS